MVMTLTYRWTSRGTLLVRSHNLNSTNDTVSICITIIYIFLGLPNHVVFKNNLGAGAKVIKTKKELISLAQPGGLINRLAGWDHKGIK